MLLRGGVVGINLQCVVELIDRIVVPAFGHEQLAEEVELERGSFRRARGRRNWRVNMVACFSASMAWSVLPLFELKARRGFPRLDNNSD